ncbi:MATE family efflux transporter [Butyrivibrio proteoclasticus]|uniref:MATE family efflux transporter n=1 Tax=Butyrivibrio proteoclasticus TaxID=43305 RepID=UPI00047C33DF|nr:MATE family efflux transporter [Butyrivibrio proteoclasticus]
MKKDNFLKRAFKIAIPVALQAMLQSSFSMVDQLMVGQLGKTAIAAVEVGSKPGFVFTFVSGAVATVTGIMVSQYMGKEDEEKINVSMSVNLCVMMLIAVLTALACFFAPCSLARIFTEDSVVAKTAASYIGIVSFIYPLSGIATILAVQIRCKDHSEYPLYVSAAASVVNTVLNFVLIFGFIGMPAFGVKGAAIASLSSQVVNLALMVFFYVKTCSFKFDLRMNKEEMWQYIVMLMPIVLNELLWTVGQNVNTYIYGHMGTNELAGMSLTGPIQGLLIGALSGLAQAAGILIGKRLGEKEYDKAYSESKQLCLYGFAGAVILSTLLVILRSLYIGLFKVDLDVRGIGGQLLLAFAILAPVKVMNMILGGGIIRSGGRTKYIMIIDMLGTWLVGVPLGLYAGLVLKLPIVWTYFILSQEELFRLVITIFMFRSKKWMNTIT